MDQAGSYERAVKVRVMLNALSEKRLALKGELCRMRRWVGSTDG